MFHGTIFGIKYNKPLAIIIDPYRTNKLETMLEAFSLRDCVTDADGLSATLACPIDYERINQRIAEEVELSLSYLKRTCTEEE